MPRTKKKHGAVINGLNTKQRMFVKAYIDHKGNGTNAYMEVYQPKSKDVAASLASELLRNTKILNAIDVGLQKQGIFQPSEYIKDKILSITEAGTSDIALKQAKVQDALQALNLLAKLSNLVGNNPQSVSLHKHYHGMTMQELEAERSKLNGVWTEAIDTT